MSEDVSSTLAIPRSPTCGKTEFSKFIFNYLQIKNHEYNNKAMCTLKKYF